MKTFLWTLAGIIAFCGFVYYEADRYTGPVPGAPGQKKHYVLSNGKGVDCAGHFVDRCGVHLSDCADGHEYRCQTNIQE